MSRKTRQFLATLLTIVMMVTMVPSSLASGESQQSWATWSANSDPAIVDQNGVVPEKYTTNRLPMIPVEGSSNYCVLVRDGRYVLVDSNGLPIGGGENGYPSVDALGQPDNGSFTKEEIEVLLGITGSDDESGTTDDNIDDQSARKFKLVEGDRYVEIDADGNPVKDANGNYLSLDENGEPDETTFTEDEIAALLGITGSDDAGKEEIEKEPSSNKSIVLVMDSRYVEVDEDGNPVKDGNGNYLSLDENGEPDETTFTEDEIAAFMAARNEGIFAANRLASIDENIDYTETTNVTLTKVWVNGGSVEKPDVRVMTSMVYQDPLSEGEVQSKEAGYHIIPSNGSDNEYSIDVELPKWVKIDDDEGVRYAAVERYDIVAEDKVSITGKRVEHLGFGSNSDNTVLYTYNTVYSNLGIVKTFVNDGDTHKSVTVQLQRSSDGGKTYAAYGKNITLAPIPGLDTQLSATLSDLPMGGLNGSGNPVSYVYRLVELAIDGNAGKVADYTVSSEIVDGSTGLSGTITNTKKDPNRGTITIHKTWNGMSASEYNARYGDGNNVVPLIANFYVYGKTEDNNTIKIATPVSLTPAGGDSVTVGIDLFDANGKPYEYSVIEIGTVGTGHVFYEGSASELTQVAGSDTDYEISFNNVSQLITFEAGKKWNPDPPAGSWVEVELYQNGTAMNPQPEGFPKRLNAADGWDVSVPNLPRSDENGDIKYTLREVDSNVENYTAIQTNDGGLLNVGTETPTVIVEKNWANGMIDRDGTPIEGSVRLKLQQYVDGDWQTVEEWEVGAGNNQELNKAISGLETGVEYRIVEESDNGNWYVNIQPSTFKFVEGESKLQNVIVTNSNSIGPGPGELISSIPFRKYWNDNGTNLSDEEKQMAHNATFYIFSSLKPYDAAKENWEDAVGGISNYVTLHANLSAEANPGYVTGYFRNLQKYIDGVEVFYTIVEVPVNGYVSSGQTFPTDGVRTFTNTRIVENVTKEKTWEFPADQPAPENAAIGWELAMIKTTKFILYRSEGASGESEAIGTISVNGLTLQTDYMKNNATVLNFGNWPAYSPKGEKYYYRVEEDGVDPDAEVGFDVIQETGSDKIINRYRSRTDKMNLTVQKYWENKDLVKYPLPKKLTFKIVNVTDPSNPVDYEDESGTSVFTMNGTGANWSVEIKDVPRYIIDAEGNKVMQSYEIVEVAVDDDPFDPDSQVSSSNKFTYTRTATWKMSEGYFILYNAPTNELPDSGSMNIRVYKAWDHGNNPGTLPTESDVGMMLMRNGVSASAQQAPTRNDGPQWPKTQDGLKSALFTDIIRVDGESTISVSETKIPANYYPRIKKNLTEDYPNKEQWAIIENVYTENLIDLSITKVWDAKLPGVDMPDAINVLVEAKRENDSGKLNILAPISVQLTATNNWTTTISVPGEDFADNEQDTELALVYKVTEVSLVYGDNVVPFASSVFTSVVDPAGWISANGDLSFGIENENQNKTEFSFTKAWIGDTADTRPIKIDQYLTLKRGYIENGALVSDTNYSSAVIPTPVKNGTNWKYTFTDLEKYVLLEDATSATEYVYYVVEEQIPGYAAPVYSASDYSTDGAFNGGTITNELELFDINVSKKWGAEYDNYADVIMRLYQRKQGDTAWNQNQIQIDSTEIKIYSTDQNGGNNVFVSLPSHYYDEDGTAQPYVYKVIEDAASLELFDAVYSAGTHDNFDIVIVSERNSGATIDDKAGILITVKQNETSVTDIDVGLLTVTNTLRTFKFEVNKKWEDDLNPASSPVHPETITVKVWSDASGSDAQVPGNDMILTVAKDGTYTSTVSLPSHTYRNGKWQMINYWVEEDPVPANYERVDSKSKVNIDSSNKMITVENKWVPFTVEITKTWNSGALYNKTGFMANYVPDSIDVKVSRKISTENEFAFLATVTLTEDDATTPGSNVWQYSTTEWGAQDDAGKFYTYSFEEVLPTGYSNAFEMGTPSTKQDANGASYAVTNTLKTIDLKGTKTWEDDSNNFYNLRTNVIELTVSRVGDDDFEQKFNVDVKLPTGNIKNWEIKGLPAINPANGEAWVYTVVETPVDGYEITSEDGDLDIVNAMTADEVEFTKVFSGRDALNAAVLDSYPTYPVGDVELVLHRISYGPNNEPIDAVLSNQTPDPEDGVYTYTGLPMYYYAGGDREEYTYYVVESPSIVGYSVSYSDTDRANEDGTVTNTLDIGDITVTKEWPEGDTTTYEITYKLEGFIDGETDPVISILNQKLSGPSNLSRKHEGLPTHWNGQPITYEVTETPVPNYSTNYRGNETLLAKGDSLTITIVNGKNTINKEFVKKWVDYGFGEETRPDTITVTLKRMVNGVGDSDFSMEKDLDVVKTGNDDLKWTFTGLDQYRFDGVEYVYFVEEDEVDGYTPDDVKDMTITNTLERTTELKGTKAWIIPEMVETVTQPTSITVKLYRSFTTPVDTTGEAYMTEEFDTPAVSGNTWSFGQLPQYVNDDGEQKQCHYLAVEVPTIGYESAGAGYAFTNKLRTTTVNGVKKWSDEGYTGARPEKITISLYRKAGANGAEEAVSGFQNVEITNNMWSFGPLLAHDMETGETYTYYVKEAEILGYTKDEDGMDVTNTLDTGDITVTKRWPQGDTTTYKITYMLEGFIGGATDPVISIPDQELFGPSNLSRTHEGLPTHWNGQPITYKVTETPVPNYSTSYDGNATLLAKGDDLTITIVNGKNTISKEFVKKWVDYGFGEETRPDTITVTLKRMVNGVGDSDFSMEKDLDVVKTGNDDLKWTFTGLDQYRFDGVEYVYFVEEDEVDGYTPDDVKDMTITNTLVLGDVTFYKAWSEDTDYTINRPGIELTLMQGNAPMLNAPTPVVNNAGTTSVTYTYKDVPVSGNGGPYVYTLVETAMDGYTTTYVSGEAAQVNEAITNTLRTIDINVEKVYEGDENSLTSRQNVTVNLTGMVDSSLTAVVSDELTLTGVETNPWTGSFDNLPKYWWTEANGFELITYTVTEEPVPGYTLESIMMDPSEFSDDEDEYGVTITNVLDSEDIEVVKTWDLSGMNDAATIQLPEDISVTLNRKDSEGEYSDFVTNPFDVNGARDGSEDWTETFSGLPTGGVNGTYTYYAEETEPNGFYEDSDEDDLELINKPILIDVTVTKEWLGEYDNSEIPAQVGIALKSEPEDVLGEDGISVLLTSGDSWYHTFENLPTHTYDNDGVATEIEYYAEEQSLDDGFVTSIGSIGDDGKIEITNTIKLMDISIDKSWLGEGKHKDARGDVTITLYRKIGDENGEKVGEPVTVDASIFADGKLDYEDVITFTDLPMYKPVVVNGVLKLQEYTYYVEETEIPNYVPSYDNNEITSESEDKTIVVMNTMDTTSVPIQKIWDDMIDDEYNKAGIRPNELTFYLWRNGDMSNAYDTLTISDIDLTNDGFVSDGFIGLPVLDRRGTPYIYTVTEEPINGYDDAVIRMENIGTDEEPLLQAQVTNPLSRITVRLVKNWIGDTADYRPAENLVVTLNARTSDEGEGINYTRLIPSSDSNMWTATFNDLPKANKAGEPYMYSIVAEAAEGDEESLHAYTQLFMNDGKLTPMVEGESFEGMISNTLKTVRRSVIKSWKNDSNNEFKTRPTELDVWLTRKSNNTQMEMVDGSSRTLSESNSWMTGFDLALPMYPPHAEDEQDVYIYEIQEEENIPNYKWSDTKSTTYGDLVAYTLVNTLDTIKIVVNKTWTGDGAWTNEIRAENRKTYAELYRPTAIRITVTGNVNGENVITKSAIMYNDLGTYQVSFELPKTYVEQGIEHEIEYSVAESMPNGSPILGYAETEQRGDRIQETENGIIRTIDITNVMETIAIRVTKTWTDIGDREWPEVTIALVAGNNVVMHMDKYDEGTNEYVITGLPMYNSRTGTPLSYRAIEDVNAMAAPYYLNSIYDGTNLSDDVSRHIIVDNIYDPGNTRIVEVEVEVPGVGSATYDSDIFRDQAVPLSNGVGDLLHLGDCFD